MHLSIKYFPMFILSLCMYQLKNNPFLPNNGYMSLCTYQPNYLSMLIYQWMLYMHREDRLLSLILQCGYEMKTEEEVQCFVDFYAKKNSPSMPFPIAMLW